jgi:DNA repair photolyase
MERRLHRIFVKKEVKNENFLDNLLAHRITWHFGGMSDPFQPCNEHLKVTDEIVKTANKYGVTILFSTKSDTAHGADIRPDLHSFQMSVTNVHDRNDIEPNVPEISKRIRFYNDLKKEGFKVGIRIQPFIPGISTLDIIDAFHDADHFTIEGLKAIPQEGTQKDYVFNKLMQNPKHYTQNGLMNMKPDMRIAIYKPFIERFEKKGMSYSISDNDLRYIGNNNCCCGDRLAFKTTGFDTTAMCMKHDKHWKLGDLLESAGEYLCCKCDNLVSSNRTFGCKTVKDFCEKRFPEKTSPMSPRFQYIQQPTLF